MIELENSAAPATQLGNIVEITPENFQQALLEESQKRLVVVDFWADWCAPCKALMPILEKLANEYNGQILLAKVNCDEQQAIAAQFGVRSLPTVALLKDGQPVDGFMGAQPESEIRQMLEKHLPKEHEVAFQQAQEKLANGELEDACALLNAAHLADPKRSDIALTFADVLIELGNLEAAHAVIGSIPLQDQDAQYNRIKAKLELAEDAVDSPELKSLEEQLAKSPDDAQLSVELAVQYSQVNRHEEALELLLACLRKDLNAAEGEAKKTMTDILFSLTNSDALKAKYQRKLYTLLY
ncbi:thioredoxin [Litoribrevibacter albus]|uniref:Thioredoxin n=1 Tax=Litoribrevibacter albus TaxID=1473156 RepID=A0AA37S7I0_9GAMM|nr:thioredoxin [Litoribrevibacter albus]GLQ30502.1 co-chaperone YbbN [Litoribrevibacter albus]